MRRGSLLFNLAPVVLVVFLIASCSSIKNSTSSGKVLYVEDSGLFYAYNSQLGAYNLDSTKVSAFIEYQIDSNHLELTSRAIQFRNVVKVLEAAGRQKEGALILANFCVDSKGTVLATKLKSETTALLKSTHQIQNVLKAIMGYKFHTKLNSEIECGSLTIRLDKVTTHH